MGFSEFTHLVLLLLLFITICVLLVNVMPFILLMFMDSNESRRWE